MDPYYKAPPLPTETYKPQDSAPLVHRFASLEEALLTLNNQAATEGFSIVYDHTKLGRKCQLKYSLTLSKRALVPEEKRQRKRFWLVIKYNFYSTLSPLLCGTQVLEMYSITHAYTRRYISTLSIQRRIEKSRIKPITTSQLNQGAPNRQILSGIYQSARIQGTESSLRLRDITNIHIKLQREFLGDLSPIQALLAKLPKDR